MKKAVHVSFLLSFIFAVTLVFITGCQEQNKVSIDPSNMKQVRLVAAENMEMKKQLAKCEKEIKKQKSLVEKCKIERKKEQETGNKLTEHLFLENIKLTEENKKLKAQIK